MLEHLKLPIYKGIIQYLLESTNYNLKRIAKLSNSSIGSIKSIHSHNEYPKDLLSELELVQLYQIILELHNRHGALKINGFNKY